MIMKDLRSEWKVRMAHEKATRDALALCNDKDPESFTKDTEGSLEMYCPMPYKFVGNVYWKHMAQHGHTSGQYSKCSCYLKYSR